MLHKGNLLALFLVSVLLVGSGIYYGFWRVKTIEVAMDLAGQYVQAISSRNSFAAMDVSTGKAAEVALLSGNYPASEILEITKSVLVFSPEHVTVQAEVEFLQPTGFIDVAAYRIDLTKMDEWKVSGIVEVEPLMLGRGLFFAKMQTEVQGVFHALVDGVRNKESTIERLLVGPAKQKLAFGILELPGQSGEITSTVIASGNKKLKVQFSTSNTTSTVIFYKTIQGWKVFDVS